MAPYTQPCGCLNNCDNCEAKCHAGVLLRWTGDYDFSGNPHISTFPGYHKRLLDWQDSPTSLIWRIRYDEHQKSQLGVFHTPPPGKFPASDASNFIAGGEQTGRISGLFWVNSQARSPIALGPIRNGRLYGFPKRNPVFTSDTGYTLMDLDQYPGEILSVGDPGEFPGTGEDYDDNKQNWVAGAFVLEVGCVRCGKDAGVVTWPDKPRLEFDPSGYDVPYADRTVNDFLTKSSPLKLTCQPLSDAERRAVFWSGNQFEPNLPPPCAPDAVMWNATGGGWPMHGFAPEGYPYITSDRSHGWGSWSTLLGRRPRSTRYYGLTTPLGENLDSCNLTDVETLWIITSDPFQVRPTVSNDAKITDWLDSGVKRLFMDPLASWGVVPTIDGGYVTTGQLIHPIYWVTPIPYPYFGITPVLNGVSAIPATYKIFVSNDNPFDDRDKDVPLWTESADSEGALLTGPSDGINPGPSIGVLKTGLRNYAIYKAENIDFALFDLAFFDAYGVEFERHPIAGCRAFGDSLIIRSNINFRTYGGSAASVYDGDDVAEGWAALSTLINAAPTLEGLLP